MDKNIETRPRVAVVGGGSFGTAIAHLAARNRCPVQLWTRNPEIASDISDNHCNSTYLPGLPLADSIEADTRIEQTLQGAELVFICVPSKIFRQTCARTIGYLAPDAVLISTTKGIEEPDFLLMSQVLEQELAQAGKQHRVGVLSGPNLAREIVENQYAGAVVASKDEAICQLVQRTLPSDRFRVYSSSDCLGVELGGALKNIYAIVLGMAAGAGVGKNTEGLLLTRSIAEMCRFAQEIGADPATFLGLSGIGDLFATCTSPLSRNFSLGLQLAGGSNLQEAQQRVVQTAEGVNTLRVVHREAARRNVSMPLVEALAGVLFDGFPIARMVDKLMQRTPSEDVQSTVHQGKEGES